MNRAHSPSPLRQVVRVGLAQLKRGALRRLIRFRRKMLLSGSIACFCAERY